VVVEKEHFEKAFRVLKPSVGPKDRVRYQAMATRYGDMETVESTKEFVNSGDCVVNEIISDNEVEMLEPKVSDAESNLIPIVGGDNPHNKMINDNTNLTINIKATEQEKPSNAISKQSESRPEVIGKEVEAKDSNLNTKESDNEGINQTLSKTDIVHTEVGTEKPTKEPTVEHLSVKKPLGAEPVATPKISIRSPDNLNGEVSKFYNSIALVPEPALMAEVPAPGVELRFLPDMVIRVVDNSTVKDIGGKSGKIVGVRAGGEKATVKLDGLSGARIVSVKEVEVELPEEGDKVKSLVWGSPPEVGEVVSLDDDDNAVVKFSGGQRTIQIDMLCKVEVG